MEDQWLSVAVRLRVRTENGKVRKIERKKFGNLAGLETPERNSRDICQALERFLYRLQCGGNDDLADIAFDVLIRSRTMPKRLAALELDGSDPILASAGALDLQAKPRTQDPVDRFLGNTRHLRRQSRSACILHRHENHRFEREAQLLADHMELHIHVHPMRALESILEIAVFPIERQRIEGDASQPRQPVHPHIEGQSAAVE